MPRNTGTPPAVELVDIKFRDGVTVRATEPRKWRWTLDDPAYPKNFARDIEWWQPALDARKP